MRRPSDLAGVPYTGYAMRVMSGNVECSACSPGALNEVAVSTPINTSGCPYFEIPVVQVLTGAHPYDGKWLLFKIPIPATYNPSDLQHQYWKLRYELSGGTATDTLTVAVGLEGPPVHLVP